MNSKHDDDDLACPHWVEALDDGTPVLIRPLREEDRERGRRFLGAMAHDVRHFRHLAGFDGRAPSMIDRLMDVDPHGCRVFVALVHDTGQLCQIGLSRYAAIPGSQDCTCAVAVSEPWRRKGLGRLLMRHLIDAARGDGLHGMVSRDLAGNYGMHRLAKALGFSARYLDGDVSEIIHELALRE